MHHLTTWHVRLEFETKTAFGVDEFQEAVVALDEYSPAAAVAQDHTGGDVSLFIDAPSAISATLIASELFTQETAGTMGAVTVRGVETQSLDEFERSLSEPLYPDVVGYAEIAQMAGVSRQRARQLAETSGFPPPVIRTAQGPLMSRSAVENWVATRNTSPGRPRRTSQSK